MKNLFSGILAIVILLTSTGFTVSSHTCGGEVVKTAVSFGNTDVSCGMEKESLGCDTPEQMKSNCCHDEFRKVQLQEDFTLKQITKTEKQQLVVAFVAVYFNLFNSQSTRIDNFNDRAPPPLVRDIPLEVQSFLI